MRQIFSLAMVALVALTACKKENKNNIPSGTYKGTFQRISAVPQPPPAAVTLTFSGAQYNGQSTVQYYPAVCNGHFSMRGNTASFHNACAWTANFDGTFILDGEYEITLRGDSLYIIKGYDGIVFQQDKYSLKRDK